MGGAVHAQFTGVDDQIGLLADVRLERGQGEIADGNVAADGLNLRIVAALRTKMHVAADRVHLQLAAANLTLDVAAHGRNRRA